MSKDMAAEWGYVLVLFAAVFVLYTVHGDARTIVMSALLISLTTVNAIKLIRAVRFQRAVKSGQTMRVTGTVTFKYGHKGRRLDTCAHAWARYSLNGKELIGAMICAADQILQIDQSIDISTEKRHKGIRVQRKAGACRGADLRGIQRDCGSGCGGSFGLFGYDEEVKNGGVCNRRYSRRD